MRHGHALAAAALLLASIVSPAPAQIGDAEIRSSYGGRDAVVRGTVVELLMDEDGYMNGYVMRAEQGSGSYLCAASDLRPILLSDKLREASVSYEEEAVAWWVDLSAPWLDGGGAQFFPGLAGAFLVVYQERGVDIAESLTLDMSFGRVVVFETGGNVVIPGADGAETVVSIAKGARLALGDDGEAILFDNTTDEEIGEPEPE